MKRWIRALAAGLLASAMLVVASPANATDSTAPIPPWCKRTINIAPVSMYEGTYSSFETGYTWFRFTVEAPGCLMTGATVRYKTVHGNTNDEDLIPSYGTLAWTAGDLTPRTVYVRVLKDSRLEPDEVFVLETACPGQGVTGGAQALATILNDDGPPPPVDDVEIGYHCEQ